MKSIRSSIKKKVFIEIVVCMLLLVFAFLGNSYYVAQKNLNTYYGEYVEKIATDTAHNLKSEEIRKLTDAVLKIYPTVKDHAADDEIEKYADIRKMPVYQETVLKFEEVRNTYQVKYMTMVYPDLANKRFIFLADADSLGTTDNPYQLPGNTREMLDYEYEMFKSLRPDIATYDYSVGDYEGDKLWSACTAVVDGEGNPIAYVWADVSQQEIRSRVIASTIGILPILLVLILIISLFAMRRTDKGLVGYIQQLSKAATTLVTERKAGIKESDHFSSLNIHTGGDELEELADSLSQMEHDLNKYMDSLQQITAANARIRTELDLARRIQENMLPNVFPPFPNREEIDIYAVMEPAKEVGGDFYDFLLIDDDHLGLVVADVSGKGIPAALFMTISKTMINNTMRQGDSPGQALENVNNILCENNTEEMFVTVWLGIVELSTGTLTYANAGHENLLCCRDGRWEYLCDRHGFVLGAIPNLKYEDHVVQMKHGDWIFQYTDGVTEARTEDDQLYGCDRLAAACRSAGKCSAEELLDSVRQDIDHFTGGEEQFDDITMLAFHYDIV